ncbi:MAG TPA: hypothetical protein VKQ06_02050 [Gammaproteobacteria bacterium]|nr:hypothetical protein [Gammaproteobacteria bacterium]
MEEGGAPTGGWQWLDFNGDRRLSLEDASGWFFHVLFIPGDMAIDLLIAVPALAALLELGPDSYGGVASTTISVMFWIAVAIAIGAICHAVRDFDRAVTAFIVRRWQDFTRSLRVARRVLVSRVGLYIQRRRIRAQRMDVGELELQKFEAAVLRCYSSLSDERTLAANDVARMLRVSVRNTQKALLNLAKLRLVQPVFESHDSHPAYQITQAGQIFLLER